MRIDNMAFRARIATRALLLAGVLLSCLHASCCRPAEAASAIAVSGIISPCIHIQPAEGGCVAYRQPWRMQQASAIAMLLLATAPCCCAGQPKHPPQWLDISDRHLGTHSCRSGTRCHGTWQLRPRMRPCSSQASSTLSATGRSLQARWRCWRPGTRASTRCRRSSTTRCTRTHPGSRSRSGLCYGT